ncbi:hypothetical protein EFQ99_32040 [Rhizobium vallis]|uniref:Uncharacterized protein n=1 Tax=Rhizobium vallis TaxID=634290 RepID=A0A432PB15_9HYPH|nr:hypothetical protein [Rhizobium vallis]RUM18858.1 hypothetical protein EFQ99_32040 [Rhizobium vallis]
MLALVLLTSCSEEQQISLIGRLTSRDLYEKGTNCEGFHYRIEGRQMVWFGEKEPRAVGRDISLSEKENSVIITDHSWGRLTVNSVFTFSDDRKTVKFTDIYYSPEPTEDDWRIMDKQAGDAKAKFQAYRDSLKDIPQMELCQRKNAS